VPWTVKVPNIDEIYFSRLRRDMSSFTGFMPEAYDAAAEFCAQEGVHLDQALQWADAAINSPFIGRSDFTTLSTKALVLTKMGRDADAKTVMDTALHNSTTTPIQIHVYGRQLLAAKKTDEAMKVFQYNAERNGDAWPVHVGLARGYAALGETQKALEHAKKALPQAPDPANRNGLESMIDALSKGQPIG
jgi:Tfp pilus assembly protein PilF